MADRFPARRRLTCVTAVLALWWSGCGAPPIDRVTVQLAGFGAAILQPQAVTVGDVVPLRAEALSHERSGAAYKSEDRPQAFRWTSSDPAVLRLEPDGAAHALAAGTVTVWAETAGIRSDPLTIVVAPPGVHALTMTPPTARVPVNKGVDYEVVSVDAAGRPVAGVPVRVFTDAPAPIDKILPCVGPAENRTPCTARLSGRSPGTIALQAVTTTRYHQPTLEASATLTAVAP